ncbi:Rdx family-domain-containing protein [Hyaloscypha sp. PMI_1271]|nr:Rdx family-domain-containing protein [Hyaloscypha sp. PMI_1271]
MADLSTRYPRIAIEFCTACKWNLRAAYFAQELLQTFSTDLGEVSLQPATGGIFKVHLYDEEPGPTEEDEATIAEYLLWDRKAEGGFPETKELKRRVRDIIDPNRNLGHVDGKKSIPSAPPQNPTPQNAGSSTKPQNYMGNPPIPRALNRLQHLSVEESHPSVERKFTPMDVDVNSRPTSSKGDAGEGEVLNSRGKIVITGDSEGGGYCMPGDDCG